MNVIFSRNICVNYCHVIPLKMANTLNECIEDFDLLLGSHSLHVPVVNNQLDILNLNFIMQDNFAAFCESFDISSTPGEYDEFRAPPLIIQRAAMAMQKAVKDSLRSFVVSSIKKRPNTSSICWKAITWNHNSNHINRTGNDLMGIFRYEEFSL